MVFIDGVPQLSGAEEDPRLLMLKGRAHLHLGQVEQALRVQTAFNSERIHVP